MACYYISSNNSTRMEPLESERTVFCNPFWSFFFVFSRATVRSICCIRSNSLQLNRYKCHNIKTHNSPKILDFPNKYLFNTSVACHNFQIQPYEALTVSQITYFERILFDALKMVGQTKQFKVSLLRDTKNLMQYYAYSITSLIFLQLFFSAKRHICLKAYM